MKLTQTPITFAALLLSAALAAEPAPAAAAKPGNPAASGISGSKEESKSLYPQQAVPGQPFFVLPKSSRPHEPNTMLPSISPEAKRNFIQAMNMWNPLSIRQMINLMVDKVQAKPGLSFDEVVETVKRKANELNFKFVSHNPLYKDVQAITGKPTSRVEIFSFCDAMIGRAAMDYSLEIAAFYPCRITILEDAKKQIWLLTMDWDMLWMDTSPNPDTVDQKLRDEANRIRRALYEIMQAAARGEF